MPVNTPHTDHVSYTPIWKKLQDLDDGAHAIEAGGEIYLPSLNGQKPKDYAVYLRRGVAAFYDAYARSVDGLHGAIHRKPTVIEALENNALLALLEDSSLEGVPFQQQIKFAVRQILVKGRLGILVDFDPVQQRPKITTYVTESIYNWPERIDPGVPLSRPIVLCEEIEEPSATDEFSPTLVRQYRVLDFDEKGYYRQRLFRQYGSALDWVPSEEPIPPNRRGQRLDFIPFIFNGLTDLTPKIEKPPLLGLGNEAIHYYQVAADFESKHHWSCVVQPWVATTNKESSYYYGSSLAWLIDPGDSAGMLETSGAALGISLNFLEQIKGNMAKLGAELLEEPKAGVEAAETVRLRQGGRASVLGNIADTSSRAFTQALRWFAWWGGFTEDVADPRIIVKINNEFQETTMSVEERNQGMLEVQAGFLSLETHQGNLKKGGVIPEEVTVQEEQRRIKAQPAFEPEDLDAGEKKDEDEEEAA